jgi:hypothetical protein
MRTARFSGTVELRGDARFDTYTKEEFWTVIGTENEPFDQQLLQRQLNWITSQLIVVLDSAVKFLIAVQPPLGA